MNELEKNLIKNGWVKDAAGNWSHPSRGPAGDRDERAPAKPQRDAAAPLAETASHQACDPGKFLVRVTSYRCTLLDEDNLVAKFHVDACRYAGLIPSDAPGCTHIQVDQVKVSTKEEEHTRIVISKLL